MADNMNDTTQADATAKSTTERVTDAAKGATDTLRQGAEKARDAFNDHVVEPAKRAGEAIKETGEKMQQSGSTIGMKMIDQAETNTSQAFAAMRAAANAKDLSEVMTIQGSYLREQGQRSMTQAREIGELIMEFGRNAVTPLRGGSGEGPKPS